MKWFPIFDFNLTLKVRKFKKLEKYIEKKYNFETKYGLGWHFYIVEQIVLKL
jgi:hypothetical protein